MTTLPPQRTFEKGVVVSVDVSTGLVTYVVDGVEHEALTISGFMPAAGQPVQIAVNGNDRLVLPPAGVDPSLYGTIQTGAGPVANPNTLDNAVNIVGWDASFGVTTWQFDANTESWGQFGASALVWDGTTGQNEGGGGGVVGSLKGTVGTPFFGAIIFQSPIVTVLRDADLASLASAWVRSGQSLGTEGRQARITISWYDSTGTTQEKSTYGDLVDINGSEWTSLDTSDFGPVNPLSNKARIGIEIFGVIPGEIYYVDNGLLMAPTNTTIALNDPADTVTDTFNRADTTNAIGTGAPTTWTARSGTWGITGNKAYMSAHGGGLSGNNNGVTTTLPGAYTERQNVVLETIVDSSTASPTQGWGLLWRYVDNLNYWALKHDTGTGIMTIRKYVAGVLTSTATTVTPSVGDHIKVVVDGNWHRFYHNGTLLKEVNDAAHNTSINHGLFSENVLGNRWDTFSISPIHRDYVRETKETSLEITSIAAGTSFARTPGDVVFDELPAVRKGEYWIASGYVKQRRSNGTGPLLYLFVITVYDKDGIFLANDFGGGFGPPNFDWRYMISAFEIKHPRAARIRVNVAFLPNAAGQKMYVSNLELQRASVLTAPVYRSAIDGPRLQTLPTPTGPQVRVFKSDDVDLGYSRMIHGNAGVISATTDGSGFVTFNHGLNTGEIPLAVICTPRTPNTGTPFGQIIVESITATTARARCISNVGGAFATVAVSFHFLAIAPF